MAAGVRKVSNLSKYDTRNAIVGFGIPGMLVPGIPIQSTTGLWMEQCKVETVWEDKRKGPHPIIYCKE